MTLCPPRFPLIVAAMLGLLAAGRAQASENLASLYLLGTGGPGAAILPPV